MSAPNLDLENELWQLGYNNVIGIDEVGRGSWAGPLVAAGVILPKHFIVPSGFAESKQISFQKREEFSKLIIKKAVAYKIVQISSIRIDNLGISKATQKIFRKIVRTIIPKPDYFLIDAFRINYFPKKKQTAILSGDKKSATIAAASIIAKVYRDRLMTDLSRKFPKYGFEKHKGYGTKLHQEAITNHGFSKEHRTTYNLQYLIS